MTDVRTNRGDPLKPLSWKEMKRIAHEDHADEVMKHA